MRVLARILGCLLAVTAMPACSSAGADTPETASEAIRHGSKAFGYPEAVTISFQVGTQGYVCSGAVVAPYVVLTAGHCVRDAQNITVTAPFAKNQVATGRGDFLDYADNPDRPGNITAATHDVGLIYLDTPIVLESYPGLSQAQPDEGTLVSVIGRKRDGADVLGYLFASSPLAAA